MMWSFKKKREVKSESIKGMVEHSDRVVRALKACKPAESEVPTINVAIFLLEQQAEMLVRQERLIEDQSEVIVNTTASIKAHMA